MTLLGKVVLNMDSGRQLIMQIGFGQSDGVIIIKTSADFQTLCFDQNLLEEVSEILISRICRFMSIGCVTNANRSAGAGFIC